MNAKTGTATLTYIPAIGLHTYKAIFNGTATAAASTSSPSQTLTVTGLYPTTTAIAATGNPSGYDLMATVVGFASHPPILAGSVTFQDTTNNNNVLGTAPRRSSLRPEFHPGAGFPGPDRQRAYNRRGGGLQRGWNTRPGDENFGRQFDEHHAGQRRRHIQARPQLALHRWNHSLYQSKRKVELLHGGGGF